MTDKFQRFEGNDCEIISFVQSKTRTLTLHSINLSMCEINSFFTLNIYLKGADTRKNTMNFCVGECNATEKKVITTDSIE